MNILVQKLKEDFSMTKNLCILPWIHMEVSPIGDARPCCLYIESLKDDDGKSINLSTSSFFDAWSSKDLRELRQKFLRGEKPKNCSRCWEVEAIGKVSKRQNNNERFSHHLQNLNEENPSPVYLDLKLGTLCNLKCRTCSTESSSRWYSDEVKLFGKALNSKTKGYWPESDTFWEELEETIPSLEFIDFAGGEPLLLTKHFNFLHKCVEMDVAKNISIHYNTNGTIPIIDEMIELWSNFKWVEVMFSLDAIEEKFEYIRHPAKWNKVRENFESLLPYKNIHLTICYTFGILNVLYLEEFFAWKNSYDREIDVYLNPIYVPTYYNIKTLSKPSKEKISKILGQIDDKGIQRVIDFMMSEHLISLENNFLKITTNLDQIRGETFSELFPELNDILKANDKENKAN